MDSMQQITSLVYWIVSVSLCGAAAVAFGLGKYEVAQNFFLWAIWTSLMCK